MGVSKFLQKNRIYEVLGLFVLLIVGIILLTEWTEWDHLARMKVLNQEIQAMNTETFYFGISILILIDIVQGKYQKNLLMNKGK